MLAAVRETLTTLRSFLAFVWWRYNNNSLNTSSIGAEGARALAEALKVNQSLQTLEYVLFLRCPIVCLQRSVRR